MRQWNHLSENAIIALEGLGWGRRRVMKLDSLAGIAIRLCGGNVDSDSPGMRTLPVAL
jgi:hypothetical protein